MPKARGPYNPTKNITCPVAGCDRKYSSEPALGRHMRTMVDRCIEHRKYYYKDIEEADIEQELIELGKSYANYEITMIEFTTRLNDIRKKREQKH